MTYYDKTAKGYNELHGEEQIAKAKLILENIKVEQDWEMLDIGAGTGISTALFKCKKMCIDSSSELLKQNPFPHVQVSAEELPFDDNRFDLVISITAIHNFKDPEKVIKEMKRVGKNLYIITLLKKSQNFAKIESLLKKHFIVAKTLENRHDLIYILNKG